jgi:hypothetical protein
VNNKFMKNKKQIKNNKSGFISIFAIFFAAVVTSVLLSLYVLLIKQIELLNIDASSFQSFYMTDSAFECALYKEQIATGTESFFLPGKSFGNCANAGDAAWIQSPVAVTKVATSTFNYSMNTQQGDFCGVVTIAKLTEPAEQNNRMFIAGQSRSCADTSNTRVIERAIDFVY